MRRIVAVAFPPPVAASGYAEILLLVGRPQIVGRINQTAASAGSRWEVSFPELAGYCISREMDFREI